MAIRNDIGCINVLNIPAEYCPIHMHLRKIYAWDMRRMKMIPAEVQILHPVSKNYLKRISPDHAFPIS